MTRAPAMSITSEAVRIGVVHRQGAQWRVLIAERFPGAGGGVRVVHARSVPFGDSGAARAALDAHGVKRVLRVAPASRSVARVAALPAGDEAALASAAGLLAEAELPQSIPAHRRGWGLLPWTGPDGATPVLLLGWSGECDEPGIAGASEQWTTEPAALVGLLSRRPEGLAWYADHSSGSIGVLAVGPEGVVVRAVREQAESDAGWSVAVEEHAARTARRGGLAGDDQPRGAEQAGLVFGADPATARAIGSIDGARRTGRCSPPASCCSPVSPGSCAARAFNPRRQKRKTARSEIPRPTKKKRSRSEIPRKPENISAPARNPRRGVNHGRRRRRPISPPRTAKCSASKCRPKTRTFASSGSRRNRAPQPTPNRRRLC